MESVLVDQGLYAKRNNSSAHVFSGSYNSNRNNNGYLPRSASQQLLGCHGAVFPGTRPPLYATSPVPAPTYWSLPPHHLVQQPCPPLLPLPLSRSFCLSSPSPPVSTRKVTGAATARSAYKDQKKPRSSPANTTKGPQHGGSRPHKDPPAAASPPAPYRVPKSAAATASCLFKDVAAKEGGNFTGDVYALSPPPSSLPMPTFSLRARRPSSSSLSSSCALRDALRVGAGADAGASDDLRQLLRL